MPADRRRDVLNAKTAPAPEAGLVNIADARRKAALMRRECGGRRNAKTLETGGDSVTGVKCACAG